MTEELKEQETVDEAVQEELKFENDTEYGLKIFQQYAAISSLKGLQAPTLMVMFAAFIAFGIYMFVLGDITSGILMLAMSLLMPIGGVWLVLSTARAMEKHMLKSNANKPTRLSIVCGDTEVRATNKDCTDVVFRYEYKHIKKIQSYGDVLVLATSRGQKVIIQKSGFKDSTADEFVAFINSKKP
ncbi:MAG: YcxB family protein [Bacillota bacterium]